MGGFILTKKQKNMKLPIRLENAITKLYTAFHNEELNAMDCKMCAVGNICSNNGDWDYLGVFYSHDKRPSKFYDAKLLISSIGYSVEEVINIEDIFIRECNYSVGTKEQHFKGLCAVVEYLCELDNVQNVMDYTKLFETENDKPKYQLS